jgi:pimeloyl-ACP methyl ester carboxylesterase
MKRVARFWGSGVAVLVMAASVVACRPTKTASAKSSSEEAPTPPKPTEAPPVAAVTTASAREEPAGPPRIEPLLVPGDRAASMVRAKAGSAPLTVFVPGICSNASAYLHTFPEAARRQGGVVALEGDQACGNSEGFRTFSWDAFRLHGRIEAALAAAGVIEVPREGITIVGYSQGAALAEQMVTRWPHRYARVVLIGAPTDPSPRNFGRTRALVTMSCDRDVPARMKQAAQATSRTGVPATYFEMPGCTHGSVGDAERVFDAAFEWMRTSERAPNSEATPTRIVGTPATTT